VSSAASLVRVERDGGRLTITLDDPENRNALGSQMMRELVAACEAAESDPEVRVVVLTNTGGTFCAGANLKEAAAPRDPDAPVPDPAALFGRFATATKPYVGRIAGHCVAGGMGLAAAMDIAVAQDDALFGFTEVRIGVIPAVVSVVCLPKLRDADARAAVLRGNRFAGTEASRMGLIHDAVPAAELDAAVDSIVDDLLRAGPEALAAAKRLLRVVPALPVDEAFAFARDLSAELFASGEAAEGMRAFREKRPPSWAPTDVGSI
jgi:methylglutaconyl-CoA hydratase